MRNFGCSDPCDNCGTDANGNYTNDRCPTCGERSKGEKVCQSCENDAAWQKHLDESGVDVQCTVCDKTIRAEGENVKFCSVKCAMTVDLWTD